MPQLPQYYRFLTFYNFYSVYTLTFLNVHTYNYSTVNSDTCPVDFMESLLWLSTVVPQYSSDVFLSFNTQLLPQCSVHTSPHKCDLKGTTCTFTIVEQSFHWSPMAKYHKCFRYRLFWTQHPFKSHHIVNSCLAPAGPPAVTKVTSPQTQGTGVY